MSFKKKLNAKLWNLEHRFLCLYVNTLILEISLIYLEKVEVNGLEEKAGSRLNQTFQSLKTLQTAKIKKTLQETFRT